MTKDEALKMALEWMETIVNSNWRNWGELASPEEFERWVKIRANHSAVVLRQALEQPEQEPVAWMSDSPTKGNGKQLHWTKAEAWRWSSNITPLYTAPPKREWVGLTDEEEEQCSIKAGAMYRRHKYSIRNQSVSPADDYEWHLIRAIEAKLKEKNT